MWSFEGAYLQSLIERSTRWRSIKKKLVPKNLEYCGKIKQSKAPQEQQKQVVQQVVQQIVQNVASAIVKEENINEVYKLISKNNI